MNYCISLIEDILAKTFKRLVISNKTGYELLHIFKYIITNDSQAEISKYILFNQVADTKRKEDIQVSNLYIIYSK